MYMTLCATKPTNYLSTVNRPDVLLATALLNTPRSQREHFYFKMYVGVGTQSYLTYAQ